MTRQRAEGHARASVQSSMTVDAQIVRAIRMMLSAIPRDRYNQVKGAALMLLAACDRYYEEDRHGK